MQKSDQLATVASDGCMYSCFGRCFVRYGVPETDTRLNVLAENDADILVDTDRQGETQRSSALIIERKCRESVRESIVEGIL